MTYERPGPQTPESTLDGAHERLAAEMAQAKQAVASLPSDLRQIFGAADSSIAKGDYDLAHSQLEVAAASLTMASLPSLAREDAALSRDEVRLRFEASGDAYATALQIVQGADRDLAAALMSSWGQAFLATKGISGNATKALQLAALRGSVEHGRPEHKRAAEVLERAVPAYKRIAVYQRARDQLNSPPQGSTS
jgi:hypothetical protein